MAYCSLSCETLPQAAPMRERGHGSERNLAGEVVVGERGVGLVALDKGGAETGDDSGLVGGVRRDRFRVELASVEGGAGVLLGFGDVVDDARVGADFGCAFELEVGGGHLVGGLEDVLLEALVGGLDLSRRSGGLGRLRGFGSGCLGKYGGRGEQGEGGEMAQVHGCLSSKRIQCNDT